MARAILIVLLPVSLVFCFCGCDADPGLNEPARDTTVPPPSAPPDVTAPPAGDRSSPTTRPARPAMPPAGNMPPTTRPAPPPATSPGLPDGGAERSGTGASQDTLPGVRGPWA